MRLVCALTAKDQGLPDSVQIARISTGAYKRKASGADLAHDWPFGLAGLNSTLTPVEDLFQSIGIPARNRSSLKLAILL